MPSKDRRLRSMPYSSTPITKRIKAALLPLTLVVLLVGMGVPAMVVPAYRLAEINENLPTKERCEDFSAVGRFDHYRNLRLEQRRTVNTVAPPTRQTLDRAQSAALRSPPGHRLANGLLAPITC